MSIIYENVLERLKEERIIKGWSQTEMGRIAHMSQSHYSKAEQGKRRFSYYEIQCLCESDIDSYYIFTGKRCESSNNDFWLKCTYEELLCFLNIICSVIEFFYVSSSYKYLEETYMKVRYLKNFTIYGKKEVNIFVNLRMLLGYNQKKMADIMGVDIKKLRELEKGKVLPDSEIIWRMFYLYDIPPAIIVKSKNDIIKTIVNLLCEMGDEKSDMMFTYLKQIHFSRL